MARLKYYHLSLWERRTSILATGLRVGEDSHMYLFTEMIVSNTIARDQAFTPRYDLYEVDRAGLSGRIRRDHVAELASVYQRRVRQALIEPADLTWLGTWDVITDRATEWDYQIGQHMFRQTPKEIDTEFFARAARTLVSDESGEVFRDLVRGARCRP
ncbi:MAG: hypothetical protein ACHREM_12835 [Polyangiales bacterium]